MGTEAKVRCRYLAVREVLPLISDARRNWQPWPALRMLHFSRSPVDMLRIEVLTQLSYMCVPCPLPFRNIQGGSLITTETRIA